MTDKSSDWSSLVSHNKHQLTFGDAIINVNDGVFTPRADLTYSSKLIIDNLPPLVGCSVADIGTGTGVIAINAALRGAQKVIATDISDLAIENTKENILLNDVQDRVGVIETSLLEGINERFDIICANLPILDSVWETQGIYAEQTLKMFIKKAGMNLRDGGKIYLPWASFAEEKRPVLENLLKENDFVFDIVDKDILGHIWYLYIITEKSGE